MEKEIRIVQGKEFVKLFSKREIRDRVSALGKQISADFQERHPLFLIVLNGAFMFAADLMRELTLDSELEFVRLASYDGLASTGRVETLIGLNRDIRNRHVVIVEDIIDSGLTIQHLQDEILKLGAASVSIVSFLMKSDNLQKERIPDYVGFDIGGAFVIGYGLDFDGQGRNFGSIYQMSETG